MQGFNIFFLSFFLLGGKQQPMISEFRVPLMIFAGNSYTYYNDLPTIVSKLAQAAGEGYEFDSHLEVSPLSSEPFWYILITCHMLHSVCDVNIVPLELLTKYVFLFHISYFIFHTSYFLCTRVVGPGRSTGTPTRLCKRLAPKHGMLLSFRFQMTTSTFL